MLADHGVLHYLEAFASSRDQQQLRLLEVVIERHGRKKKHVLMEFSLEQVADQLAVVFLAHRQENALVVCLSDVVAMQRCLQMHRQLTQPST